MATTPSDSARYSAAFSRHQSTKKKADPKPAPAAPEKGLGMLGRIGAALAQVGERALETPRSQNLNQVFAVDQAKAERQRQLEEAENQMRLGIGQDSTGGLGYMSSGESYTPLDRTDAPRQWGEPAPGLPPSAKDGRSIRKQAFGEANETRAMTREEYNALSPRERAAVDFNTALSRAVAKDEARAKKGQYEDVTDTQREQYEKTVNRLFGETRGSDRYAPETVALLDQLDYKDKFGDLDDFLDLKILATDEDISGGLLNSGQAQERGLAEKPRMGVDVEQDRDALLTHLVTRSEKLEQTLAKSSQVIQRFTAAARQDRKVAIEEMGGRVGTRIGWGTKTAEDAETTQFFQQAFDQLSKSQTENGFDSDLNEIRRELSKYGELEPFFAYVDERTTQAARYNQPLGISEGTSYRTPEELRKKLGLTKES